MYSVGVGRSDRGWQLCLSEIHLQDDIDIDTIMQSKLLYSDKYVIKVPSRKDKYKIALKQSWFNWSNMINVDNSNCGDCNYNAQSYNNDGNLKQW